MLVLQATHDRVVDESARLFRSLDALRMEIIDERGTSGARGVTWRKKELIFFLSLFLTFGASKIGGMKSIHSFTNLLALNWNYGPNWLISPL